jgi:LPXTG-site transpeptidase (sortase) family protein
VTFTLYSNNTCTSTVPNMSGSGSISSSGTASWSTTSWTPTAAGTYYWIASYAGDTNNKGFTTTCGDPNEEILIGPVSPTITTAANPTTGTVGTPISNPGDAATLSGGYNPTGSVTFTLYSNNTCTSTVPNMSGSGSISSSGTASWSTTSWTPTAAGTYYWIASYAGDTNNMGFTTACGATTEQIVVGQASQTISTTASPTTATVGTPVTTGDTATLDSAYNPSGSVTFTLYSDSACTVPVSGMSGNGTISSGSASWSKSWTPAALGTYYWQASYPGDANNNAYTTTCGATSEQIMVVAPPMISKAFSPTTIIQSNTSSLGFTIINPNTATALTGVAFTDILPSGLSVATSSTTACSSGTLATTAPDTIALSGGSIAGGGNCSFNVTVTGTKAGLQTNTTGNVTSTNGGTGNTASATLTVAHLFDPPIGVKTVDSSGEPLLKWSLVWINDSNIVGVKGVSHDPIPTGSTFTPNTLDSGYPVPVGAPPFSTSLGVACTAGTSVLTVTTLCYYEGPTPANPRGQIIWAGTLGPDSGVTNPSLAVNAIHITFSVTAADGVRSVQNQAMIDWDRNGNGVIDPGEHDVASVSASWTAAAPALPRTGFAPGTITSLGAEPDQLYSASTDLTIEIPALGVKTTIVGIPESGGTWDVSWLGDQVGYLEGTAFPTWSGNSVLTGHVYGADGLPGPFVNLRTLKWGDQVIIHFQGQRYIFEVRTNEVISPTDTSIFGHKDYPWLTLLTCKDYNAQTNSYAHRVAVGAVLIKIESEPPPGP